MLRLDFLLIYNVSYQKALVEFCAGLSLPVTVSLTVWTEARPQYAYFRITRLAYSLTPCHKTYDDPD